MTTLRKPRIGDTPHDMLKWEWEIDSLNWLYDEVLKSALLYHIHDKVNVSDNLYDARCSVLLLHYGRITHSHKDLFDKERLQTGTCMGLVEEDFPVDIIKWVDKYKHKIS